MKTWFKGLSERAQLSVVAGGIVVVVLMAIGATALASGGSSESAAEAPASNAEVAEVEEEFESAEEEAFGECIAAWNGSENVGPRNEISTLEASYVSITMSEIYPDKCLITAANPQLNLAAQYLQAEGGPYAFKTQASGEATSLPESATNWNANVNAGGRLSLGE